VAAVLAQQVQTLQGAQEQRAEMAYHLLLQALAFLEAVVVVEATMIAIQVRQVVMAVAALEV